MLTSAARSSYICQLCRIRLTPTPLHRIRPRPVRAASAAAVRPFSSTLAAAQSSIFDSELEGDAPVKRRPGRPRKEPSGDDAPRRGPGRPRKNVGESGAAPAIRHGPGRPPKKYTTPDEDVPWDTTPPPMDPALQRSLAAEAADMAKYEQANEYDAEESQQEADMKARLAAEEAAHRAAMAAQLGNILKSSVKGSKDKARAHGGLQLPAADFLGDNFDLETSNLPGVRWRTLGMRDVVVDTMMRVFPEATRPTYTQVRLIPPLIRGNSVLVNDLPGTGKSFAIALWLLTLDRAMKQVDKRKLQPTTTALVLLPNIDLVQQYHGLIIDLLDKTGSEAIKQNTDSFIQALYRSSDKEAEMIQRLRDNPSPHILIATPTILLDMLSARDESLKDLLDFFNLQAIVVDEIDTTIAHYTDEDSKTSFLLDDKKKKKKKYKQEEKQNPTALLLDWIFKARRVNSLKHKIPPKQPQLVISSSAVGRMRIFKTIQQHHKSWFEGDRRPGFNVLQTEISAAAKPVFVNSRSNEPTNKKIQPLIPDTISHHVVAYDIETGALRDAPVPEFNTPEERAERLAEFDKEQENLISEFEEAMEQGDHAQIGVLLEQYEQASGINTRAGYPAVLAANVLEKLIEHDNNPAHVLAAVGEGASQKELVEELNRRGIRAFQLQYDIWNEHRPIRMGRTDQLLAISGGPEKAEKEAAEEGKKLETTVWVTNYYSCRGLDTPGISHAYILHRVKKVREYVTYSGRVARWPYTSQQEQSRDPRSLGKDIRPKGKVVSVVLEGRKGMEGVSVVKKGREGREMGEGEMYAWEMEAIRIAKCGVGKTGYFVEEKKDEEEHPEEDMEEKGDKGELEEAAMAAGEGERAAVEHEKAALEQERELLREEGLEMENDGENVSEEMDEESEVEVERHVEQEVVLKKA